MDQVLFSQISLADLKSTISDLFEEKIKPLINQIEKDDINYLTRSEVSKRLKISLPTLNNLTKQGVLKGYRVGRRVLYKELEVEAGLQEITSKKYQRRSI